MGSARLAGRIAPAAAIAPPAGQGTVGRRGRRGRRGKVSYRRRQEPSRPAPSDGHHLAEAGAAASESRRTGARAEVGVVLSGDLLLNSSMSVNLCSPLHSQMTDAVASAIRASMANTARATWEYLPPVPQCRPILVLDMASRVLATDPKESGACPLELLVLEPDLVHRMCDHPIQTMHDQQETNAPSVSQNEVVAKGVTISRTRVDTMAPNSPNTPPMVKPG